MTKRIWSPVMGVALLGGCGASVADPSRCIDELARLPNDDAVSVDVERIVDGITQKQGAASGLAAAVVRCDQALEYFTYSPEGGIEEEFATRLRFAYPGYG